MFSAYGTWMLVGGGRAAAGKSGDWGSGFMPRFIGGFIIFLSALLFFTTFPDSRKEWPRKNPENFITPDYKSIVTTIMLLGAYMIALKPIGFIISSTVYVFLQMVVMANKPSKKQLMLYAIISILMPFVVDYIFVTVFSLMLPFGILE
jgi:uncharacterized BrkB/YihY/UPF0761 family membrane protein